MVQEVENLVHDGFAIVCPCLSGLVYRVHLFDGLTFLISGDSFVLMCAWFEKWLYIQGRGVLRKDWVCVSLPEWCSGP